jgi:hypothetical protein
MAAGLELLRTSSSSKGRFEYLSVKPEDAGAAAEAGADSGDHLGQNKVA